MENIQLRYIFDRKKEANDSTKTGLLQIEVRITGSNKKKLISTGIHLYKKQFSDKNGFTCKNHENSIGITGKGRSLFRQIEAFVLSDKCNSLEDVRNWDKEEEELTTSVFDFIKSDLIKREVSFAVREYNNSFLRRLKEFARIQTFNDINYNSIEEFDIYLRKTIKSSPTLYKRHTLFKGYIDKAKKKGLIKSNPYDDFIIKKGTSRDPIFLFEEELNQIIDYVPTGMLSERIGKVKDLFLFQCFTGLAYADMANFSRDFIVENDGQKEIHGFRQKTKQRYMALLLPIAEEIADKYDYKLPVMTNQKYNEYLKQLAQGAGITKPISTHSGRHTFATYLINKGISIESVSKILGHSNIRMTQHYAKLLGKTAINEMKEKLMSKPNEEPKK